MLHGLHGPLDGEKVLEYLWAHLVKSYEALYSSELVAQMQHMN